MHIFNTHTPDLSECSVESVSGPKYTSAVCRCAGSNWLPRYGLQAEKQCRAPCTGNPESICGGHWHNSVYRYMRYPVNRMSEQPCACRQQDNSVSKQTKQLIGAELSSQEKSLADARLKVVKADEKMKDAMMRCVTIFRVSPLSHCLCLYSISCHSCCGFYFAVYYCP